jgi:outer membrane biosynthesis protein TonB
MSSYRKRTTSQIEKLLLRIEEQDEKIQKLEQQFLQQQQLSSFLSMPIPSAAATTAPFMPMPTIPTASMSKPKPKPKPPVPATKPAESSVPAPSPAPAPAPAPAPSPAPAPAPASAPAPEEDLDALIQAELAELQESALVGEKIEEISTEDLKKKSP